MSQRKPFDPHLFQLNDLPGRLVVRDWFIKTMDIEARDNPLTIYGVDLFLYRGDRHIGYAEVEVRKNWDTEQFPFKTLNVPERKQKLLQNELPTYFFSINFPLTRMWVATAEVVLSSPIKVQKNKYVRDGELFYDVDINRCKLITLETGNNNVRNKV